MVYDYYKLLGINEDASTIEIKSAFRLAAKKYHPDVNKDNDKAAKLFAVINEGYQILSNKRLKTAYDYKLSLNKYAQTLDNKNYNNKYAQKVSNKRRHRYSNEEIIKRNRKRFELQRKKEAETVANFKEKAIKFPLIYRYSINGLLGLTGLVMGYENWFVSYIDTAGFLTLMFSFSLTAFGIFSIVNLSYQHFFVLEITGKTKKNHETVTFNLMFSILLLSIVIFAGGTYLKKHYELKYNAEYANPVDVIQYGNSFTFQYMVDMELIEKRQEIEVDKTYGQSRFIVKYSKANPKIAELIILK